jgi:hypothetical protein
MFPPLLCALAFPPAKAPLFYLFCGSVEMQDYETQQMILEIIDHAKSAKLTEFQFIRNWSSYKYYQGKRRSYKLLVKDLSEGCARLINTYCNSLDFGEGDFNKLLAYHQMQKVLQFYSKELDTITNMVYEYDAYLMESRLLYAFFGGYRSDEDLRDFRE